MFKNSRKGVIALALWSATALLLGSSQAFAQEQRGAIQGTVKDSSGGVLPGVTVEATSPALVGIQTAVSGTDGVYRFPALPPGRYTVSANLSGFGPTKVENVEVSIGATIRVELTMSVAGVSVAETVKAEPPAVDVKANAVTATINADVIDLIPKGRDFTNALTQIPGTNNESRSGGIMIDGSSASENRYVVDGLDTTDLRTGLSRRDVPIDFIQNIQVKQSGYNAEFRAATGGVISAITKSGSNTFSGSVASYFTSNAFTGKVRPTLRQVPSDPTKAEYITSPRDKNTYTVDPVFEVGGPILRNKMWFFLGYNPQYNRGERTVTWTNPRGNPATQTFDTGTPYDRTLLYNATTSLSNSVRVRVNGNNERIRGGLGLPSIEPDGTSTANATTYNPRSTLRTDSFRDSYSAVVDWTARNNLFVSMQGGYFGYGSKNAGGDYYHGTRRTFSTTNVGLLDVPANLQQLSGYAENIANSFTEKDNYSRIQVDANATWFVRARGDHAIKFGGLFERLGNDVNSGQQFPNIAFSWNSSYSKLSGGTARGTYGYYTVSRSYTQGNIHSNNVGFFIQDAWTVSPKLTLNIGLRAEHEVVPSYRPENPDLTFGWKDKLAPRFGFAYDIFGDARWKAYGSWGTFYDVFKLELPRGAWGADHWIQYIYTLDNYNWPSIDCTGEPGATPACSGTFIEQNDRRHVSNGQGLDNLVDPNLKPVKSGEATIGVDHEFNRTLSFGVRYTHKWIIQTIEDIGVIVPGVGEVFYIANPGLGLGRAPLGDGLPETPKPIRKYDGVEFVARKRLSNNWSATASVLVSRLWGTYPGLASSDENARTAPSVTRLYDGLYMSFDENGDVITGRLQTDRPFQFKLQPTYVTRWGTNVGVTFLAQSGTPQTTQVTYQTVPVDYLGRGDLGRSPFYTQTDLLIGQSVNLPHNMKVRFDVNVTNLFDQDTVTTVGTTKYRDSLVIPLAAGETVATAFFRNGGINVDQIMAANLAAGNGGRPNPTYGMNSGFQNPRTIRLYVRFQF